MPWLIRSWNHVCITYNYVSQAGLMMMPWLGEVGRFWSITASTQSTSSGQRCRCWQSPACPGSLWTRGLCSTAEETSPRPVVCCWSTWRSWPSAPHRRSASPSSFTPLSIFQMFPGCHTYGFPWGEGGRWESRSRELTLSKYGWFYEWLIFTIFLYKFGRKIGLLFSGENTLITLQRWKPHHNVELW